MLNPFRTTTPRTPRTPPVTAPDAAGAPGQRSGAPEPPSPPRGRRRARPGRARGARSTAQRSGALPALGVLPAARWTTGSTPRAAGPSAPAPFALRDAPGGIHLGTDRQGAPVALPGLGPGGTRVGVLGESLFGRLLACRLVAVGAAVTAATRSPSLWTPLRAACGDRLQVTGDAGGPPGAPGTPPGVGAGPRALVTDLRTPPAATAADGPWSTVVHVTRRPPARSRHWQRLDAVLVLDARYADAVTPVLGTPAGRVVGALAQGEVALFRPGGTDVLRLDIAPGETALLTPP
ncbi:MULTISPECIES: hypothetical protein [Streptomyces]|uniref:hypothetical protein n=1 Tax=Streptomyces TaxID=1883 RepID=UPI0022490718|nr:hypothetical protein [Streptomyces sp. JHD 1]MCX2968570.1 hypothetical protein [Streptomyces sp. JHD 1]